MKTNASIVHNQKVTPSHVNRPTPGKIRGLDEIAPFLHEVNKIVAEECANKSLEALPWYPIWERWNDKRLMRSPSINEIGKIICPDLSYNERTIQAIVKRITTDITPVTKYIQVSHVSDTSVIWESKIEIDSFRSLKSKRKTKQTIGRDLNTDSYSDNSSSQDATTLSSKNPPLVTQTSLLAPQSRETEPPARTKSPTTISPALHSPPKEVIITNERSLTKEGYSKMKITASAFL